MLLPPQRIAEIIINKLQKGPISATNLILEINKVKKASSQAIYKALRILKKEEVVIWHKGEVSLTSMWINKMSRFFALAEYYYSSVPNYLNIKEGEKITYHFNDLIHLDQFGSHIFYSFLSIFKNNNEPVYVYNVHDWFYFFRPENENFLLDSMKSLKYKSLVLLGGNTSFDRLIKKQLSSEFVQCHLLDSPLFGKDNYYFNIFNDFVVEIFLHQDIARDLNSLFYIYKNAEDISTERVNNLLRKAGKSRLVISHNHKKAEKLKKIYKKYFYIKNI